MLNTAFWQLERLLLVFDKQLSGVLLAHRPQLTEAHFEALMFLHAVRRLSKACDRSKVGDGAL